MKICNFYKMLFPLFLFIFLIISGQTKVITNELHPGRFGDNLLGYCKAKWFSVHYGIPLLYRPFRYSDRLQLCRYEKKLTKETEKGIKHVIPVGKRSDFLQNNRNSSLYVVYLATDLGGNPANTYNFAGPCEFRPDVACVQAVEDYKYKQELRKMLTPATALPNLNIPKGMITVAVHVRKGGGFDPPLSSIQIFRNYADKIWPLRFPPEQFYIDQIIRLSTLLNDKPLFVYIFTDDSNPLRILETLEKNCSKSNIRFSCRRSGNRHDQNVVEDLYLMSQFDCLIRPCSNLSGIAQIIGNHRVIIRPEHYEWVGNKLIIDEVALFIPNVSNKRLFRFFINRPEDRRKAKEYLSNLFR